jgi:hypothetical protein
VEATRPLVGFGLAKSISNCLVKLTWEKLPFGNLLKVLASEFFFYLQWFGKLGFVNIEK